MTLGRRLLRSSWQPLLTGLALFTVGVLGYPKVELVLLGALLLRVAFQAGAAWEQEKGHKIIHEMHVAELERMENLKALLNWKLYGVRSPFSEKFETELRRFKKDTDAELN